MYRYMKKTPAWKINRCVLFLAAGIADCMAGKYQHIDSFGKKEQNSLFSIIDIFILPPSVTCLLLQQTWLYIKRVPIFFDLFAQSQNYASGPSQNKEVLFSLIWTPKFILFSSLPIAINQWKSKKHHYLPCSRKVTSCGPCSSPVVPGNTSHLAESCNQSHWN